MFGKIQELAPASFRADCGDITTSQEVNKLLVPQAVEMTYFCHFYSHIDGEGASIVVKS